MKSLDELKTSCDRDGFAIIRGFLATDDIAVLQQNRGVDRLRDLARGPGRLAAALRIDLALDGLDLCREGPLWLGPGDAAAGEVGESVRIGISKDVDRLLRFYLRGSAFVSGAKALNR